MITGKEGEWSEIYVLLKLLRDKHILLGDKKFKIRLLEFEKDTEAPFTHYVHNHNNGVRPLQGLSPLKGGFGKIIRRSNFF